MANMSGASLALVSLLFALQSGDAARVRSRSSKPNPLGDHGVDTFDVRDDRADEQMLSGDRIRIMPGDQDADMQGELAGDEGPIRVGEDAQCARFPRGRRVVSMADQHGDYDGMVKHLHLLGLVSKQFGRNQSEWSNLWAGGDAIFVQTGDILDRGPDGRLMYKFLWALQDDAPQGSVVLLTGNHELMVLKGDIRYVTNIDFCAYTGDNCGGKPPKQAKYCSTCCHYANGQCGTAASKCMEGNCDFLQSWDKNGEMGKELRDRFKSGKMKLAYEVNGVVFIHAGLVSSLWPKIGLQDGENAIEKLNNLTAKLFDDSDGKSLWYSEDILVMYDSDNGPMWTRVCYDDWYTRTGRRRRSGGSYYMDDEEHARVGGGRCKTIAQSLEVVGAKRIVIGHCPQGPSTGSDGVETSCQGTFIKADTYMSVAYTGTRARSDYNMAALEFYSQDPKRRMWSVYSGRDKCQRLPGTFPDDEADDNEEE